MLKEKQLKVRSMKFLNQQPYYNDNGNPVVNNSLTITAKKSSHFNSCSAAICFETIYEDGVDTVIWYPMEPTCTKEVIRPAERYVRNRMRRINKLALKGKFKYLDRAYTFTLLSRIKNITKATKGLNPERPIVLKRFAPNPSSSLGLGAVELKHRLAAPAPFERSAHV